MAEQKTNWAWVKPAVWGAVGGAVGISILGFTAFGWVTGGSSETNARLAAREAVTDALVPFCVAKAESDPNYAAMLTTIKEQSSWARDDTVKEAGWATDARVAEACAEALIKQNEA